MDSQRRKLDLIKKVIASDNEELIIRMHQLIKDFKSKTDGAETRFEPLSVEELGKRIEVAEDDLTYGRVSTDENVIDRSFSTHRDTERFKPMSEETLNKRLDESLLDYENGSVISQEQLEKEVLSWKNR